jgi:hypothetical protein
MSIRRYKCNARSETSTVGGDTRQQEESNITFELYHIPRYSAKCIVAFKIRVDHGGILTHLPFQCSNRRLDNTPLNTVTPCKVVLEYRHPGFESNDRPIGSGAGCECAIRIPASCALTYGERVKTALRLLRPFHTTGSHCCLGPDHRRRSQKSSITVHLVKRSPM